MHRLDDDEMVEADNGYKGLTWCVRRKCEYVSRGDKVAKKMAMARHETINRRLKQFSVLGKRFRQSLNKHKFCHRAVAVGGDVRMGP